MQFRVTPKTRLLITPLAREQMASYAQRCWNQREAGGVLIGRHLLEDGDIVVDEVTEPQSTDRRTRYSFFRSERHLDIVQKRWREEGGTACFLGFWHTHPERDPTPSGTDLNDWHGAVAGGTYFGDRLFFPIVGTEHIRVWTISRRGAYRALRQE